MPGTRGLDEYVVEVWDMYAVVPWSSGLYGQRGGPDYPGIQITERKQRGWRRSS
jgi:hypothetical protein